MQQFEFPYEISLKNQLPEATQKLLDAAEAAAKGTPENGPLAGAALLLSDGSIVTGSGGEGSCAERAALRLHEASGHVKVLAIAISYHPDSSDDMPPLAPCGVCREAILDTQIRQDKAITVYMGSPDGEVIMVEDAAYLLPFHTGRGKYV